MDLLLKDLQAVLDGRGDACQRAAAMIAVVWMQLDGRPQLMPPAAMHRHCSSCGGRSPGKPWPPALVQRLLRCLLSRLQTSHALVRLPPTLPPPFFLRDILNAPPSVPGPSFSLLLSLPDTRKRNAVFVIETLEQLSIGCLLKPPKTANKQMNIYPKHTYTYVYLRYVCMLLFVVF